LILNGRQKSFSAAASLQDHWRIASALTRPLLEAIIIDNWTNEGGMGVMIRSQLRFAHDALLHFAHGFDSAVDIHWLTNARAARNDAGTSNRA
jgi:hypothetical protein